MGYMMTPPQSTSSYASGSMVSQAGSVVDVSFFFLTQLLLLNYVVVCRFRQT